MNDSNCCEPARSYDIGTYLWAIDAKLDGPEHRTIVGIVPGTNKDTVCFGMKQINADFERDFPFAP